MPNFERYPRFLQLCCCLCCVLLAACSATPVRKDDDKRPVVWPQLPEQPRFAYEAVLRTTADVSDATASLENRLREMSGAASNLNQPVLDKPFAVAARKGSIYVTDAITRSIVVFDVPRRTTFRFGLRMPGTLARPTGIALDAAMNVYVSDAKLRTVNVYDRLGLYLRSIGKLEDLERPTGVAVSPDGERIYAIDRASNESSNHRVVVFDREGRKQKVIGTRGSEPGQFNVPLQAVVATDGTLYVLDAGNFRVQAFDREGNFLRAFGKVGDAPGTFARPRGIAVDAEGNVYVTDASFNNIQVFTSHGELLLAIGNSGSTSKPGQYGLLSGVSVDETGRMYVVDQLFNKVEVIRRLSDGEGQLMLQAAAR